eukprot:CAMPEP_0197620730 /NCGR_PEP_ID=MMETSP1338-20131121/1500_1 /TAXON_ID=43686 ORGANISM="Pelagodinium beii, Strain RCC1491" /NCGR_SAMPLE_ID=MMETSP1338 /ASSEMBLY_ACC=CAM_ASM_000754 /LENGTH=949 /DNA_ID=CAMNT_0043190001 /DNA_START=78 /DNA_END=2927 /DNA_ORIENTATION=+
MEKATRLMSRGQERSTFDSSIGEKTLLKARSGLESGDEKATRFIPQSAAESQELSTNGRSIVEKALCFISRGAACSGWEPSSIDTSIGEKMLRKSISFFPEDAASRSTFTPRISKFNNYCSVICILMATYVHLFLEYSERQPAISHTEDPWMVWFLQLASTLAAAGFCQEVVVRFCIQFAHSSEKQNPSLKLRERLNWKLTSVFFVMASLYQCMAFDYQYVHKGWLADYHGGHQVVYSFRYIEWVFCSPIVLSCYGHLDPGDDGRLRNGIIPSSVLTGMYCIIAWQALVVTNAWVAWTLIFFSFVCYFGCAYEQLYFAWGIKDKGAFGRVRAGMLVYLVLTMGLYGLVYMSPILGIISASMENKFFCLGDPSFKLGTSCVILVSVDVSNLEDMYQKTLTLAADLTRLIDTANVPIFGTDRHGKLTTWNARVQELTGLSKLDAMDLPLLSIVHDSHKALVSLAIEKAFSDKRTTATEFTLDPCAIKAAVANPSDLKTAMLVSSVSPMTSSQSGDVSGAVFICCDLTEVSAVKEAEARKNHFLSVMSHELRSPLHGIISMVDVMLASKLEEKQKKRLTTISTCGKRLLELVTSIMDMASFARNNGQHGANRVRMCKDLTELPKIIEETVMLIEGSYDKRGKPYLAPGVQLINKVKDLPIIEADAHKCTQVFYNLITNACKFTEKGTVILTSASDPEGHWVEISVSDSGIGITKQNLPKIFEPFEQLDISKARCAEGIGLGLSIAREVVDRHGGSISVTSKEGVGTTFTVRLPSSLKDSDEAAHQHVHAYSNEPNPNSAVSSQPVGLHETSTSQAADSREAFLSTLLSVDDSDVNQDLVKDMLEGHYNVVAAMSGAEALTYLDSSAPMPDIMLLDVMMPGMSGIDACKLVREKHDKLRLPIVMYSASGVDQTEAFKAGCNDYIVKPASKEVLRARLATALELKNALASLEGC